MQDETTDPKINITDASKGGEVHPAADTKTTPLPAIFAGTEQNRLALTGFANTTECVAVAYSKDPSPRTAFIRT